MTTSDPRYLGLAAAAAAGPTEEEATGADGDLSDEARDSDGVPVGAADADADAIRAGADPDEVRRD